MNQDALLSIDPEEATWAVGSLLAGEPRCERGSPSWARTGERLVQPDTPHVENVGGIACLFVGRGTRNLLPAGLASFAEIPEAWANIGGLGLAQTGQQFGSASLCLPDSPETTLTMPAIRVDPREETAIPSTGYLGVLYQFSVHARGSGAITLELRNLDRPEETTSTELPLTDSWRRVCIALDGVFAPRNLRASITANGSGVQIDGLMLEPYVVTYRSMDRAKLVPSPGPWTPGGTTRDRDRITLPLHRGAIPPSGMIDFWFRPAWHALHPQHTFFQACHSYFGLEVRAQEPLFFAGEKACPWRYYWEWALAGGYEADTWHHYALIWRERGGATVYFDGQSRGHAEQTPAHAFDPARAGDTLVIGGSVDGAMSLDPNVPGELDAYLASFRMQAGEFTAAAVLAAKEGRDPREPERAVPSEAVFLNPDDRHLITRAKDHCWFVHNLAGTHDHLYTAVSRREDHHPGPNLRQATWGESSVLESRDGGRTWHPGDARPRREPGIMPDGRQLHIPYPLAGDPPRMTLLVEAADGTTEEIESTFDVSELRDWLTNTALCVHKVLPLQDGDYLLFASGAASVLVFRSPDLRQWRVIACPYRPNGVQDRFNETSAVQLPNGRIVILMRTGGWNMMLAKGISDDGGYTWSPPLPSGLRGIQPRMRLLSDGTIVLVTGRPGIIMAASCDGGESFATIACAEDDRIHEFSDEFGWYGYSSMNNGVTVDEAAGKAFISYDLLDERADEDGTLLNACYIRPYDLVRIKGYDRAVRETLRPGDDALHCHGDWSAVAGRVAITNETGAALSGSFEGAGLVALLETCTHSGTALVEIDGGPVRAGPLYLPYCRVQRVLLVHGLENGKHRFRIALAQGHDPEHKFANPEMPMLGGEQTFHMAGTTAERRLAVYGFEILK